MQQNTPSFLVDGISAIAVHNGIARIEFMCLGLDGKPKPALELQIPQAMVKSIAEAFKKLPPG